MKTTIGGDRLGSGNKQEVSLKNYSRSTHDLSYIWRSSMASGTLVPFMSEVGLPGDSFDIDLNCNVKTLPTVGPLFGSYKVQLDVFSCPVRLYQGKLHMNMLNIGMDMSEVLLPQIEVKSYYDKDEAKEDNTQINASCILSYLNIRGLGRYNYTGDESGEVVRNFNAVPYLGYWDIYKNYYANKQEERGFVIHNRNDDNSFGLVELIVNVDGIDNQVLYNIENPQTMDLSQQCETGVSEPECALPGVSINGQCDWEHAEESFGLPKVEDIIIKWNGVDTPITQLFADITEPEQVFSNGVGTEAFTFRAFGYLGTYSSTTTAEYSAQIIDNTINYTQGPPQVEEFSFS